MSPENVWDYPRPPRLESVPERIRIVFAGRVIAETRAALRVLETSHPPVYYLPPGCFDCGVALSERQSVCEWKGIARYVSLTTDHREATDCGWTYPLPLPPFAALAGFIAVYPSAMEGCFVDDERVRPQPGRFYGGWVTDNLTGPFKGAPGTMGW